MNKNFSISDFIVNSKLEDFPENVITMAKWAFIDTLGVGLSGSKSRASMITRDFLKEFPMMHTESTIWGAGDRTSCIWAALVNSMAASCLDADDGHRGALGHPGGIIVPVSIAAGERVKATGKQLLEAIIIGYEVGLRAGMLLNKHHEQIFYGSGTWGTFGAAAAASKILGLDHDACINALGIAEIHTPLALIMDWIRLRQPPEVKEGMGWASLTGLTAAILAGKGMIGSFSFGEKDEWEKLISNLKTDHEILKLYFKQFPACRWTHATIDGIIQAGEKYALKPDQIAKICVHTFAHALDLDNPRPDTIERAQYSIPFVVGSVVVYGRLGPSEMDEKRLKDPLIHKVADRVTLEFDPELDSYFPEQTMARIEITTTTGDHIEIPPQKYTLGDFRNPLTPPALEKKFRIFAGHCLSVESVEKIIALVLNLEKLTNLEELTGCLAS